MREETMQRVQARTIQLLQKELTDVFATTLSSENQETLKLLIEHIVMLSFYEFGIPAPKYTNYEIVTESVTTV
jgi:hypothetical protein